MIQFNNKYFTLLAIIFLIYIFYSSHQNAPKNQFKNNNSMPVSGSKYKLTIDPTKPDSEKSLIEKWLINKYMQNNSGNGQNNTTPILSPSAIKVGDSVKITYKDLNINKTKVISLKVGEQTLPKVVEDNLIGMDLGVTKVMNLVDDKGNKLYIEVTILGIERTSTPKS